MPKNSRRKKKTRDQAVRGGERYMRASRTLATPNPEPPQPQPLPTLSDLWCGAALGDDYLGVEDIHEVQRLVEARGWVVTSFCRGWVDQQGMALSIQVMWEFAAAFGGAELEDEEDVEPQKPTISLHGDVISIQTAGNWGGCPEHHSTALEWPWTARGLAELPGFLEQVEGLSLTLDPQPYIDCLADGPCAALNLERWGSDEPFGE